jgi:hypothetical protein
MGDFLREEDIVCALLKNKEEFKTLIDYFEVKL